MAKEGYKDVWVLYTGARELSNGVIGHQYHIIDAPHDSDLVKEMTGFNFESGLLFDGKLHKKDTIGWIRPCQLSNDGKNISTPPGIPNQWRRWYNNGDIAGWSAKDLACKATQKKLKEIGKDVLLKQLQPIQAAMRTATREQKRLIIAEVLLIINS